MDNRLESDPQIHYWLDKFATYHPASMDMGLDRLRRLLSDLNHPERRMPPVIHVAGTNGKGSTIAFLKAILNGNGLTCHVMTSPHLVEYRERFVVADKMVSNAVLVDYMAQMDALNQGQSITYFELITALGFKLFADFKADVTLLETGMGGRLDATNVVDHPRACVITMISRDHVKFLGHDLKSIAFEKAGIMKRDVPCVIGVQTFEALRDGVQDVFAARAAELNVPLYRHGFEWDYTVTDDGFDLCLQGKIYHCPRPNLVGDHQYANAATALVAALVAGFVQQNAAHHVAQNFDNDGVNTHGIAHAVWPARLQKFDRGALVDLLQKGDECWLDGGHNDTGGEILARQIDAWRAQDQRPVHLIVGMLNTKNPTEFLNPLRDKVASITAITIPDQPQSLSATELQEYTGGGMADGLKNAIKSIKDQYPAPCRILIAGSLYLAGHVIKENG